MRKKYLIIFNYVGEYESRMTQCGEEGMFLMFSGGAEQKLGPTSGKCGELSHEGVFKMASCIGINISKYTNNVE